jgi:hypothetical protein
MDRKSDAVRPGSSRGTEDVVAVRYRCGDGKFVDTLMDRLQFGDVLAGLPVREFRAYRGRRHYSGWYWSATTGRHVVYESRLELARILLADQDPNVVAIAAQPLLLEGFDGVRVRRHVPDLLLGTAGGGVLLVDVKAASRLADPVVAEQFAWMRRVCGQHGVPFDVWSGTDAVWLENIRFLAGYRRANLISGDLVTPVLDAAVRHSTIGQVERALDGRQRRGLVRPVILHLLWTGALTAKLTTPLSLGTEISTAAS